MSVRTALTVSYVAVTLGMLFSVTVLSTRRPILAMRVTTALAVIYLLLLVVLW